MPCDADINLAKIFQWAMRLSLWISSGFLKLALAIAILVFGIGSGQAATINADIAGLCDRATVEASRSTGVPLDVLRAISLTETGRSSGAGLQPWPWTVNMEGRGHWFATLDEARSYVFRHFKNGARSFDVGCFQINYRWHGHAFRSIDDMFDPRINAQYAAEFLLDLYQEFGNWSDAAGAYHSRTPKFAKKYIARFERIRAGLSGGSEMAFWAGPGAYQPIEGHRQGGSNHDSALIPGARPLVSGGMVTLGSLVPMLHQPGAGHRPFVVIE